MRKQCDKKTVKQPVTKAIKGQSNFGKLALISVLCASLLLACFYFTPLPEDPSEQDHPAEPSDSKASMASNSPASTPRDSARLNLPEQTVYTSSAEEKKRLLNDVEKAVETYPADATILHIAGLTYSELLQTAKAIEYLERAIKADSTDPQVVVELAEVFMQFGKQEEATTVLERALERGQRTESLLSTLGEAYSQTGRMEDAVKTLELAVATTSPQPEQSKATLRLAQALTQLGRFEEAEKYARTSLSQRPTDVAVYVALSNVLMNQKKREEALEIQKRIPKLATNLVEDDQKYELSFRGFASHNYAQLGSAYAAHQSVALAEQFFVRSLELTPDSASTALRLADLLKNQGRAQDAITTYKRLVQIQPDNLKNYHNLASLAVSAGDLPLAENALRMATNADKTGAADLRLARFLLGSGNVANAVSHSQIAVDRLGTLDAYLALMDALSAVGDRTSAHQAYLKAKAIAPNDPRLAPIN